MTVKSVISIAPQLLLENAEGILCLGKENFKAPATIVSPPLTYRDTVLPDGTPSRLYFFPTSGPEIDPHLEFVCWGFPDGVRVLLDKDTTSFLYPSGLKPGLYNLVPYLKIKEDHPSGIILVEYLNPIRQISPWEKPFYNEACQYMGYSMYAKVRVIRSNEECSTQRFYVRVIEEDSNEKARFDVHPVVNHHWGLECAQWQWVDCNEDFCVTFGVGTDFTIRIIEK